MDPVTQKHLNLVSFVIKLKAWRFISWCWEIGAEKQGSGLLHFFIKASLWEQCKTIFCLSSLKAAVLENIG